MRKQAKGGNKKQKADCNETIEKMEKELADRHQREVSKRFNICLMFVQLMSNLCLSVRLMGYAHASCVLFCLQLFLIFSFR